MNSQITTKFLTLLLSHFDQRIFPLALFSSKGSEISVLRFHEISLENSSTKYSCKSVSERHIWQSSFMEKFFSVFFYHIFFFTVALYGLPNITLQIPKEQSYRKASLGKSCNSVRWINRTQSSFSESFFPVFNGGYFLFHHSPLWASKYHVLNSTRTVLAKGFLRGKL